jgi:acetyl esterase/lipase
MRRRSFLLLSLTALSGCAGLRIRKARDLIQIIEDVPYLAGSADPKHRLDLYLPRGRAPFPVVLFVHGGFWRNQDRRYLQGLTGLYGNVGAALARRGIGVAVQSYRLSPRASIEDQLGDVTAALRWVLGGIERHGGDPDRLVLAGYSAGGHLVSLLAHDPRRLPAAGIDPLRVRGVVSLSGLLDLAPMAAGQDEAFNRDVTFRLFGRDPAALRRYSPLTYLSAGGPPMLLLAAERDYPYVLSASRAVAERLAALGGKATHRVVPGITHAGMVLEINGGDDHVSDDIAAFVRAVTDGPRPAPAP